MKIIKKRAYSRVGLIGNPSDGYHGKTISTICPNFFAEVVLYKWDTLEILLSDGDRKGFDSIHSLVQDVESNGYYGGVRLIKATIKRFVDYCKKNDLPLHNDNFAIRYSTSIPRAVGLGGSSAIVIATLRCLMAYYDIKIPIHVQPSLALSVETEELGIPAGLQDRVIQVYEGIVYMDFSKEHTIQANGFTVGMYERIDPTLFPPIYMAYSDYTGEPTEILHNNLRQRFNDGDEQVIEGMKTFAKFTDQTVEAAQNQNFEKLWYLIDANFDLRRSLCSIPQKQLTMIEQARTTGACGKFAGSGGAIVGFYKDSAMFQRLVTVMNDINCKVVKIIPSHS